MKKLHNNQKGFTLAELLIVVAIIAVLAAISIPILSKRLEGSREATDIANLRSAYSAAETAVLTKSLDIDGTSWLLGTADNADPKTKGTSPLVLYYTPEGSFAETASKGVQGQGTATNGGTDTSKLPKTISYAPATNVTGQYLQVTFSLTEGEWSVGDGAIKFVSIVAP